LPVCVPTPKPSEHGMDVEPITPRFFQTWGVPIVLGRDFESQDQSQTVIVNEAFVEKFFPNQNPIGQEIATGKCPGNPKTIVGVVANHRDRPRVEITPMVYVPYPFPRGTQPTTFAARTVGDLQPLLVTLRKLMADSGASADGDVMTGTAYTESKWRTERLLASCLALFSALGLIVSCVGIYSLSTYTVSWRRNEIGLRMALGAQRTAVIRMVTTESLIPTVVGIVGGCLAAMISTRWIASVLFGVSKFDLWTIGGAAISLLLAATFAAFFPARRACRIDPMKALRHD